MKTAFTTIQFFLGVVFLITSICRPSIFGNNKFLTSFVEGQLIQVVSVLVTVSLVNALQVHLEYTRIERKHKTRVFEESRKAVSLAVFLLISAFILSFVLSIVYPLLKDFPIWVSIFHCAAILLVLECIFIMYDLIETAVTLAKKQPI